MNNINVSPGDVVVTQLGAYQHWALCTDKKCPGGNYMLISATKRTLTVKEEPWAIVTHGKPSYVVDIGSNKTVSEVLAQARSYINKWQYSVRKRNCEHFVKKCLGLKAESSQVNAAIAAGALSAVAIAAFSEKPKKFTLLGTVFTAAGLAVMANKAPRKILKEPA